MYQNEQIFLEESETNTFFLPNVDFKLLWNTNISLKTRNIIWKYLQLILFNIVNNVSNTNSFGNTADLFQAIDEDEFKTKIEETMENIQNMFSNNDTSFNNFDDLDDGDISNNFDFNNLPNPEDIHSHLDGILNGKIGNLAKEIAEETTKDLDIDTENMESPNELFEKLFKNPSKLMGLVKDVGNKLDTKLKSGNLKESELLEEASEIMEKIQNMPGMGNFKDVLNKMGMPTGGKGGNVNFAAMQSHLQQNLKSAKQKERLQNKLKNKNKNVVVNNKNQNVTQCNNIGMDESNLNKLLNDKDLNIEDFENLIFSDGSQVERTPREGTKKTNNKKKRKKKPKKD